MSQLETYEKNKERPINVPVSNAVSRRSTGFEPLLQLHDDYPAPLLQSNLQVIVNSSPQIKQAAQLQTAADNFTNEKWPIHKKSNELIQRKTKIIHTYENRKFNLLENTQSSDNKEVDLPHTVGTSMEARLDPGDIVTGSACSQYKLRLDASAQLENEELNDKRPSVES